jgi:hypothetical protein
MPKLSQFAAKAAMLYLVTGAVWALGYWLNTIWQVLPGWTPLLQALSPTYVHLITVGWLTQFIFGVMYWMFPVISKARPRGDVRLAWAAFICLNAGLLTRAVCEPWRALQPLPFNGAALVVSAILQAAAAALCVWISWPRVRERGGF